MVRAEGMEGEGMMELTEKQLVEKANLAIGLMDGQMEDKPKEATFVGASKLGEAGVRGILYEMNSEEVMEWLKRAETMREFTGKMGLTVGYKAQTYKVVVDWVPTTLDVNQMEAIEAVEQANRIQPKSIKEMRWIKPKHLRNLEQKTAITIFSFATREGANQAIGYGMYVEGKKVWGRKQIQEPRRCLKCQCYGEHKAAKCMSIHETCGHCGKQHKTVECQETNQEAFKCTNCKTTKNDKHRGHGAADRQCPVFKEWTKQMNRICQENNTSIFAQQNQKHGK